MTGGYETAVNATFNQWTVFSEDKVGNIDEKMYVVNQAALGVWYQLNNAPKWRTYITLLYSIVLDGFGRQVGDTGVFEAMFANQFSSSDSMNKALCPKNLFTAAKADLIY